MIYEFQFKPILHKINKYLSWEPLVRNDSGVSNSLLGNSKSNPPVTGNGSFLKDVVDPEDPNSFWAAPRKFCPVTVSSWRKGFGANNGST